MHPSIRDREIEHFSNIIANIREYGIDRAISFMNAARAMTVTDVSNIIMLGLVNRRSQDELITLAKFIGARFTTYASVVKSNYWAKRLVDEGIPLSSFVGYNPFEIERTQTLPVTFGPIELIKSDDLNGLLAEYGNDLNRTFNHANKYRMNLTSYAALLQAVNVFKYLYDTIGCDDHTIKMAIKGGNDEIIRRIMQDYDLYPYMDELIKHHKNNFVRYLTARQYQSQERNQHYRNVSENCLNFGARHYFY